MKLLRETIRKILLENQQRFTKLVEMIMTKEWENVNYALKLASALEYVTGLQHKNVYTQNQSLTGHQWTMTATPEFIAEIKKHYTIDFDSNMQIFYDGPSQSPNEIKIKLYVPKQ